jgi:hypothetical protein
MVSVRRGGLRVYLERPWFSSGDGELLGVVYLPPPFPETDEERQRIGAFVTRAGDDPVHITFGPPATRGDLFPLARRVGRNLSPAEPGLPALEAAGHEVRFDDARGEWFADVRFTGGHYFPFVRLAVARYQPDSVPGCELSEIVPADFVQLPPDRTLTVKRTLGGAPRWEVLVNGEAPLTRLGPEGLPQAGFPRFEVAVERRRTDVADETLGWEVEPGTAVVALPVPPPLVQLAPPGPLLWRGEVSLLTSSNQAGTFRLIVKEFEQHLADPNAGAPPGTLPQPVERLTYAAIVPL